MSEVLKKTIAAVFDVSTALVDQSQVWGGVNSEKAVFFILTRKIILHDQKGNDHQLKKLLIVRQILLVSSTRKCIEINMENLHTEVRV